MTINFSFRDRQIVRSADDGEIAHGGDELFRDVPTEFLREFVVWNDRHNDSYEEVDRAGLLRIILEWYEQDLTSELQTYCDSYGLPQMSADELQAEIDARDPLAGQHVAYLKEFSGRWDEMTDLYYVLQRG